MEKMSEALGKDKMKRSITFILISFLFLAVLVVLVRLAFYHPHREANRDFTNVKPVHAVRVDYQDIGKSRGEVKALEAEMKQAGVNMVAVGAGRVDWTYFPWKGHNDRWASEVKQSGIDFLAEDSARFGSWAHVSAVVDVLAPRYIQAHPEAAAISWAGLPSKNLVSTMDLVEGEFGQELLGMIEVIAEQYPVNSILITELVYYGDGYGEKDQTAYLAYTGRADWPRTADGQINIDDPSIGAWRSYEIGRFLEKASKVVSQYSKQLFIEARISLDEAGNVSTKTGTDLNMMLKYTDRLVVWGNHDLGGRSPEALSSVGQFLTTYGADQVIMMIGLWDKNYSPDISNEGMSAISAEDLKISLASSAQGGMADQWVTPSFLLSETHWQVLKEAWSKQPGSP
jgi:hypothetical protein